MSWTDKELSEMAKAAQAEQKFAYQDSFWGEVEAMLPAKKKKAFPFFWLALVPVVATLGYLAMPSTQVNASALQAAKTLDNGSTFIAAMNQNDTKNDTQEDVSSNFGKERMNTVALAQNAPQKTKQSRSLEAVPSRVNPFDNKVFGEFSEGSSYPIKPKRSKTGPVEKKAVTIVEMPTKQLSSRESKGLLDFTKQTATEKVVFTETAKPDLAEAPSLLENEIKRRYEFPILSLNPLKVAAIDNASELALQPFFSQTRKTFWNAYAEGGFSMGQSYMASQVGHTSAFNLGLGARYDFNNYFVQFGVAGELQNVKFELSEREKIYHTSSTVFENIFSYKQLYRAEMPLTIGYQFPKHMMQLSVIPSYLVGTKMKYEYLENGSSMRNETIYEMEHGKKTAWNDFSTSFALGYGYRITKTITLGANVKWQLMNQLNKNIATVGNVRPLSGQVFIRKTLK